MNAWSEHATDKQHIVHFLLHRRVWDFATGKCKLQIGLTWEEREEKNKAEREGR